MFNKSQHNLAHYLAFSEDEMSKKGQPMLTKPDNPRQGSQSAAPPPTTKHQAVLQKKELNQPSLELLFKSHRYNRPKIIKECITGNIKQKGTKGKKNEKGMKKLLRCK